MDLLKQEMQKPSRRPDVIKSLLSRTFPNRWNSFVNNNQPETLAEYIQQFPVLKKCNYVSIIIICVSYGAIYSHMICM